MKSLGRSAAWLFSALLLSPALSAHPGHDGHDFTWEMRHLAEHPVATLGCFGFLAAAMWIVWKLAQRTRAAADQGLRVSQARRGK